MNTAAKIPGPEVWFDDDEPTQLTKLLVEVAAKDETCRATHERVKAEAPEIARRVRSNSEPPGVKK